MLKFLPIVKKLNEELEHLRLELDHANSMRVAADDEKELLQERLDESVRKQSELQSELLKQSHQFTDWVVQAQGRPPIFGNTYKIDTEPQILEPPKRRQARDIVREQEIADRKISEEMRMELEKIEREIGVSVDA